MRIAKVTDGHIIKALATLLDAANIAAPEDDPDRYDAWRVLVMAARREYDGLCDEVRAARAAVRPSPEPPRTALDTLLAVWDREAEAWTEIAGKTDPSAMISWAESREMRAAIYRTCARDLRRALSAPAAVTERPREGAAEGDGRAFETAATAAREAIDHAASGALDPARLVREGPRSYEAAPASPGDGAKETP